MMKWSPIAALLALMSFSGCGDGEDAQAQSSGRGGFGGADGRSALPPVPVSVEAVTQGPIASYYSASASLEAQKQADVLARVAGVVLELRCEEGDLVAKGQPLLTIEDEEYRLRVAEAEAQLAREENRHARAKQMSENNFIAQEEYETILNELETARAQLELARLTLSYTTVTAPFAGRITRRSIDVGQNVSAGTPLFTIADFDPLVARVHVPSREFRNITPGQSVELLLDSSREKLNGRIALVSPIIDATSGTIKVTVEIDDFPPDTRPGDFAEVRIVTERRDHALLVPKGAVIDDEGDRIAYVAVTDSTVERRVVQVGFQDDHHAEIIGGLSTGERIVVQGQRSLRPNSKLRILEAVDFTTARPDSALAQRDTTRARPAGSPGRRGGRGGRRP